MTAGAVLNHPEESSMGQTRPRGPLCRTRHVS